VKSGQVSRTEPRAAGSIARAILIGAVLLASACESSSRWSEQVSSPAAVEPGSSLTFAAERKYLYALELDTVVQYGAGSELSLTLQGTVELQREAGEPGSLTLAAALPDVRVSQPEPGAEQQLAALAAELRQGFVIALDAGKITEVRSVGSVSTFAANIMRTLAAGFELPAPPAPEQLSWTAETSDAAGRYVVELTRLADAGRYRKRKLHYAETQLRAADATGFGLTLLPRVLESAGELEVRQNVLQSYRYEEKLESQLGEDAHVGAHNGFSLRLLESRPAAALPPRATKSLANAEPHVVKLDRNALDAAKIGGLSFDDVLATLRRDATSPEPLLPSRAAQPAHGAPDRPDDRRLLEHNKAFSALAALLRTRPELVPRAAAVIRSGRPPSNLVLDALAAADTAPSNAALIALAEDPQLAPELSSAASQALTRIETPTARSLEALLRLMHSPRHSLTAVYGLGTQARHLQEQGETELARRAGLALLEHLASAATDEARIHALRGIANSGLDQCLPAVEAQLTSRSELVRAAAVEALRLMRDPRVDGLIAQRLSEEKHGFALRAALSATKARRPSSELNAAVVALATKPGDDRSRHAALGVLVRWLPELPSLREVLLRIAESDSAEAIRETARSAL
jgi:hypothetical protein